MITVATVDLFGDRWVPFVRKLPLVNVNLTGATFLAHVRAVPDVTGTPLVTLGTVTTSAEGVKLDYAGSDTIANHITNGRLPSVPSGMLTTDTVLLTLLSIQINETTMEGLTFPTERGSDAVFAWDLHITPNGGAKDKYVGGKFVVRPGATQ